MSPILRQRFVSLLGLAVIQIFSCLLPLWCIRLFASTALGWSLLSALMLIVNLARVWWFIFLPSRRLGSQVFS
jgi:hypothetical protein